MNWGNFWFLGGDLNDIRDGAEKKGGRPRTAGSFRHFSDFIQDLGMVEIKFSGHAWTWANNRLGEGYWCGFRCGFSN